MASDSQSTDEHGNIMMNVPKVFLLPGGGILATAGDDDARDLIELLDHVHDENDLPSKEELSETRCDFMGLLALTDGSLWYIHIEVQSHDNTDEWNAQIGEITEDYYALGSGGQIALGALDSGASLSDAIQIAINRNAYCGGEIQEGIITGWKEARRKRKKA